MANTMMLLVSVDHVMLHMGGLKVEFWAWKNAFLEGNSLVADLRI